MKSLFETIILEEDASKILPLIPTDKSIESYGERERGLFSFYIIVYLTYRAKGALNNEYVLHIIEILANPLFIKYCISITENNWELLSIRSIDEIFSNVKLEIMQLGNFAVKGHHFIPQHLTLHHLKIQEFSHENDEWYLSKLRNTLGFDKLVQFIMKHSWERIYRIQFTGSNLRISKQMLPHRYDLLEYACKQLSINIIPDFYVQQGFINAATIGDSNPILVVHSGAFSVLSDNELLFLLGHELGHIKARHCLYHMMAQVLPVIAGQAQYFTLGFSGVITIGLELALLQWQRVSEFTADRAGLLCCQDPNAACSVLMKLSGLPLSDFTHADVNAFMDQARQFESIDTDSLDKVYKSASILGETHPWTVMRAKELLSWVEGGGYARVLSRISQLPVDNKN